MNHILWLIIVTCVAVAWMLPMFNESGAFDWWGLLWKIALNSVSAAVFIYSMHRARKEGKREAMEEWDNK